MELKDIKVLPGIVIDAEDPKYIGRVKADCPGLFDSSVMNKEGLPWIYPFSMGGYQRFSKLEVSTKIWIFTDEDYKEFWYVPMFQLNSETADIISGEDYFGSEVLLARTAGDNGVSIYYKPSEGIVLKNSQNTVITLSPNNQIDIKCGNANVTLKGNNVFLGQGEQGHEAAIMGEKLVKLLDELKNNFLVIQSEANAGWFTDHMANAFGNVVKTLSDTQDLLAQNTFVN